MKRTIAKLTLRGLIVIVACFALVPLASAHTFTPKVQTRAQAPMQTCFEENCDHVAPPPISNCNNDGAAGFGYLYDHNHVVIGYLYLFDDETSCHSAWAGLLDVSNPGGRCFTITSIYISETDHDFSAQGALDSIPHKMCRPGQWESTKMDGWTFNGSDYHFYAQALVTDELGYANDPVNTNLVTCNDIGCF